VSVFPFFLPFRFSFPALERITDYILIRLFTTTTFCRFSFFRDYRLFADYDLSPDFLGSRWLNCFDVPCTACRRPPFVISPSPPYFFLFCLISPLFSDAAALRSSFTPKYQVHSLELRLIENDTCLVKSSPIASCLPLPVDLTLPTFLVHTAFFHLLSVSLLSGTLQVRSKSGWLRFLVLVSQPPFPLRFFQIPCMLCGISPPFKPLSPFS